MGYAGRGGKVRVWVEESRLTGRGEMVWTGGVVEGKEVGVV